MNTSNDTSMVWEESEGRRLAAAGVMWSDRGIVRIALADAGNKTVELWHKSVKPSTRQA